MAGSSIFWMCYVCWINNSSKYNVNKIQIQQEIDETIADLADEEKPFINFYQPVKDGIEKASVRKNASAGQFPKSFVFSKN
jgi:hypothetical protein